MKKYINFIIILLSFLILENVSGKTIYLKECEYTKEYINWLNLPTSEKKNTIMPEVCQNLNTEKFIYVGGIKENISVNDEKFNLLDYGYVTDVKHQEDTYACWAFATNASIESNLLVNNLGEYDLSEAHMELLTQNTYDYGLLTFNRKANVGGTYYISSAYLMNSYGPILEEYLPFTKLLNLYDKTDIIENDKVLGVDSNLDVNSIAFLGNSSGSCDNDTIKDIKEYLISYGALATTIHAKSNITYSKYQFYDGKSYTDMEGNVVDANQNVDHAVTIVGWDDTISKDKFISDNKPNNDGAFVIKNSYGEKEEFMSTNEFQEYLFANFETELNELGINDASEIPNEFTKEFLSYLFNIETNQVEIENDIIYIVFGNNGYQYVSYEDINICNLVTGYFNVDEEVEENSYFYDDLGYNSSYYLKNEIGYFANIYSKKTTGNELLKEISIYFTTPNQKYEIYFANGEEFDLNKFTKIASGVSTFVGYHSIDILDKTIITEDKYTIIVKLEDEEQVNFGASRKFLVADLNSSLLWYNSIEFQEGVQFLSIDGVNYSDVTKQINPFHLTIKAYTNETLEEPTINDTANDNNSSQEEISKDEKPNTDATIDVELNDYNTNNNQGSYVDEPLENPPQTGYYFVIPILVVLTVLFLIFKSQLKNKIFKV